MSVAEEKNKALLRRYFEGAWGKGNVAAVDEFMAADYVEHPFWPAAWNRGLEANDHHVPHGFPQSSGHPL